MSKTKKLLLGLIAVLSVAICSVIAFGVSSFNKGVNGSSNATNNEVSLKDVNQNITTFEYDEGEVAIQKGKSNLKFTYSPNVNSKSSSTIAYEYIFNNPMTIEQAVNLKSIDSTNVTLSYAYSTTRLSEITSSSAPFELQKVKSNGSVYIYILVTPTNDTIPSTFQSSIVWYQGKPGTLNIYDSDNTTILKTINIVRGQHIEDDWLQYEIESTSSGYEVDGWLNDNNVTIEAGERTQGGNIYPNVPNLPTDWLTFYGDYYAVTTGTSALPSNLIIPATYNGYDVIGIGEPTSTLYAEPLPAEGYVAFAEQEGITSVVIPKTIQYIKDYSFYGCVNLESVTFASNSQLTSIGGYAFNYCTSLTSIDLSNCTSLTSISNVLIFAYSNLTSITIPSSVTSIISYAFYGCSDLTSITFEDAGGWYVSDSGYTDGTQIDVSDPSANATYFTSTYLDYYWYKQ